MIDNQCFSFAGNFISESKFPQWSSSSLIKLFPNFSSNLKINNFISYEHNEDFNKFKNKKILVVGGGPSTYDLDLNKLEIDHIFTANNFFLNKKLNNIKIDIAMVGAEVDTTSDKFIKYVEKHQPWLGFEIHPKWASTNSYDYLNKHLYNSYWKMFCMQTRYYGCVGIGHRLLVLAMQLNAKEIYYIGIDGPKGMIKGRHSFEKNKINLPKLPQRLNVDNAEEIFTNAYKDFYTHINNDIKYKGKLINLGENHPDNIIPKYNN
tara:strand:+ start:394 stop:1182 length:789 start_codon:yes stop_codon:yes gene_type:complete